MHSLNDLLTMTNKRLEGPDILEWASDQNVWVGFVCSIWLRLYLHPGSPCLHLPVPPLPTPNHEVHVSLCVWLLSTLPVFCLSSTFSLSVTVMLSQTYDDIDLENEPWYKFFSELEFGRPVSQGRSCSLNHNPAIGIHPRSPPHPRLLSCLHQ